ncbi:hypothetical protein GGI07_003518 [Coemansia sp. Benny D115]|nr:hypothetical protein GGI07_003518 [Coemansia sp. Benny D115]
MLGNFSLGALLTIRSYKFYRVFCKNKPVQGYMRAVPYIIYIVCIVVVGTISTLVPRRLTMMPLESVEFCVVNQDLVTTYSVMLWFLWSVYMAMMWILRNVRSSFNEFKEMAWSLVLLVICTISNQAILYSVPLLPTILSWRLVLVAIDQIVANYIWWLIMFKPLFNCMFRHDSYLAYWRQKMTADGLRAQYGIGVAETEMSINSVTLASRENNEAFKMEKTDPSFTDSTQLAINQLTELAEAHGMGKSDAADSHWNMAGASGATAAANGDSYFRRSISFTQDYVRRQSEPCTMLSNACKTSDVFQSQRDRRSKHRMLTQYIVSHQNSVSSDLSAKSGPGESLQSSLGVLGLQQPDRLDSCVPPFSSVSGIRGVAAGALSETHLSMATTSSLSLLTSTSLNLSLTPVDCNIKSAVLQRQEIQNDNNNNNNNTENSGQMQNNDHDHHIRLDGPSAVFDLSFMDDSIQPDTFGETDGGGCGDTSGNRRLI